MFRQSSCDGTRVSETPRCLSAAAKASVFIVLTLGLFASPLCASHARAADLFPKGSNATLVFSPARLETGRQGWLCVTNTGSVSVDVTLILKLLPQKYPTSFQPIVATRGIDPDRVECIFLDVDQQSLLGSFAVASIVLNSPAQCSQATEYPGRCGAVGSFEIFKVNYVDGGPTTMTDFIHIEPVLRPGSPRLQPPPISPQ